MDANLEAERLIRAITAKLQADKAVIARSLAHGRLSWRTDRDGRVEVKIQPEL